MRAKKGLLLLAVVLVAGVVLALIAGCGSTSTSEPSGTGSGATKTLTIGGIWPLSGDGAIWGKEEMASVQVAMEDINTAGGIKVGSDTYMMALKTYDHQWDPAIAATCARKAVSDGVRFIMSFSGPEILAENAAEKGTTVLTFSTAPDLICQGPKHPDNYMSWFYYADSINVVYSYVRDTYPDHVKVAVIATNDSEGVQEAESLAKDIEPLGFQVQKPVMITGKETDYYPVLTPLIKSGVQVIDVGSPAPEKVGLIMKQAKELGYTGKWAMADAPSIKEYADIAGWDAMEGFIGAPEYAKMTTALGKHWQEAYMAKTKGDTATWPTYDYDTMLLLKAAIEKAGSVDPAAVNKALPTVKVEGCKGPIQYGGASVLGIAHLMESKINVVEVKSGAVVDVYNAWPQRLSAP
jgi:branched-chain amino acid transport system substrate-binding protein